MYKRWPPAAWVQKIIIQPTLSKGQRCFHGGHGSTRGNDEHTTCQSVQSLSFKCLKLDEEDVKVLRKELSHNLWPQSVDLQGAWISDRGMAIVAKILRNTTTIQCLNLCGNENTAEGPRPPSRSQHHLSPLHHLILKDRVRCDGAKALARALMINTTLQELNLRNNQIHDEGVRALADALKCNRNLQQLDLHNNLISSEGTKALSEALTFNTILCRLDLSDNIICSEGAKALAEGLRFNTTLRRLDLSDNLICNEGANAIAKALRFNTTLHYLDLSGNCIDDNGAEVLAEALKDNHTLCDLLLHDNPMSSKGIQALSEANPVIQLDIGGFHQRRDHNGGTHLHGKWFLLLMVMVPLSLCILLYALHKVLSGDHQSDPNPPNLVPSKTIPAPNVPRSSPKPPVGTSPSKVPEDMHYKRMRHMHPLPIPHPAIATSNANGTTAGNSRIPNVSDVATEVLRGAENEAMCTQPHCSVNDGHRQCVAIVPDASSDELADLITQAQKDMEMASRRYQETQARYISLHVLRAQKKNSTSETVLSTTEVDAQKFTSTPFQTAKPSDAILNSKALKAIMTALAPEWLPEEEQRFQTLLNEMTLAEADCSELVTSTSELLRRLSSVSLPPLDLLHPPSGHAPAWSTQRSVPSQALEAANHQMKTIQKVWHCQGFSMQQQHAMQALDCSVFQSIAASSQCQASDAECRVAALESEAQQLHQYWLETVTAAHRNSDESMAQLQNHLSQIAALQQELSSKIQQCVVLVEDAVTLASHAAASEREQDKALAGMAAAIHQQQQEQRRHLLHTELADMCSLAVPSAVQRVQKEIEMYETKASEVLQQLHTQHWCNFIEMHNCVTSEMATAEQRYHSVLQQYYLQQRCYDGWRQITQPTDILPTEWEKVCLEDQMHQKELHNLLAMAEASERETLGWAEVLDLLCMLMDISGSKEAVVSAAVEGIDSHLDPRDIASERWHQESCLQTLTHILSLLQTVRQYFRTMLEPNCDVEKLTQQLRQCHAQLSDWLETIHRSVTIPLDWLVDFLNTQPLLKKQLCDEHRLLQEDMALFAEELESEPQTSQVCSEDPSLLRSWTSVLDAISAAGLVNTSSVLSIASSSTEAPEVMDTLDHVSSTSGDSFFESLPGILTDLNT